MWKDGAEEEDKDDDEEICDVGGDPPLPRPNPVVSALGAARPTALSVGVAYTRYAKYFPTELKQNKIRFRWCQRQIFYLFWFFDRHLTLLDVVGM